MEYLDIVDQANQPIGRATRAEIYDKLHPHRIVHVLITNTRNELALQLVAQHKPPYAGHWGTSVGGHVQAGETYEEAAERELLEEFGVAKLELSLLADVLHTTPKGQLKFIRVFTAECEEPLRIDPRETEKIEYFSATTIQKMRQRGEKFAPELLQIIEECL